MSISTQVVKFETQAELAFGSIGSSFTAINPSGLTHPSLFFILTNLSDQIVDFSMDGVNTALTLGNGSHLVFDVASNKSSVTLNFSRGSIVFARYRSMPTTSGFVAVSSAYSID